MAAFAGIQVRVGCALLAAPRGHDMPSPRLFLAAPSSTRAAQRPTREEALDAFRTLLEFCVGEGAAPTTYDQRPGHLPPDAKSQDAFKRWHRAARHAGLAGVWKRGKLLFATAEAWATPLRSRARTNAPSANDRDDAQLDAALGIRAVRRPS